MGLQKDPGLALLKVYFGLSGNPVRPVGRHRHLLQQGELAENSYLSLTLNYLARLTRID
jgi:hypothetical protein